MAAEPDAIGKLETLLNAQWNNSNTDSITPVIYVEGATPGRIDFATGNTAIVLYPVDHTTEPYGLGASHREHTVDRVTIDIRTKVSRSHMMNCYNECRRIFSSRINDPFGDQSFLQMMPIGYKSFVSQNFFRRVYDVYFRNWTLAR